MMESLNKFSLDEICKNSEELFGVYPEVIYGALLCIEKKNEYTLSDSTVSFIFSNQFKILVYYCYCLLCLFRSHSIQNKKQHISILLL